MPKAKRKVAAVQITFPETMTKAQARRHLAAALNWWTVKVIPEEKLAIKVLRK